MKRITAILIAIGMAAGAYQAGTLNPSPTLLAHAKAEGFGAGKQAVLDDLPKPTKPIATAALCVPWWFNANIKEARRRMCGK